MIRKSKMIRQTRNNYQAKTILRKPEIQNRKWTISKSKFQINGAISTNEIADDLSL